MDARIALRILKAIVSLKQSLEVETDPYKKATLEKQIYFLRQWLKENEQDDPELDLGH